MGKGIKTQWSVFEVIRRIRIDNNGCWIWTNKPMNNGYARIKVDGLQIQAHVFSYRIFKGEIPKGLELDHLCRIRNCVNPEHLEAVTHRINMLRGDTITGANAKKTVCHKGHKLDGDNLYIRHRENRLSRHCLICKKENERKLRDSDEYRAYHAERERKRRKLLKENKNG